MSKFVHLDQFLELYVLLLWRRMESPSLSLNPLEDLVVECLKDGHVSPSDYLCGSPLCILLGLYLIIDLCLNESYYCYIPVSKN